MNITPDVIVRFEARYTRLDPNDCWEWQAGFTSNGYGRFYFGFANGRRVRKQAHRVAYTIVNGPIAEDDIIMHQCNNPKCVNPAHLVAGDFKQNSQHMVVSDRCTAGWQNAQKTYCDRGHEFTSHNTYIDPRGMRQCRACIAQASREYRMRKREEERKLERDAINDNARRRNSTIII